MERILISFMIISGSVVWTWVAIRRLRGKPMVAVAGVAEAVPPLALVMGLAWAAQALVAQFSPPPTAPLTVATIQRGVMLSGGVAIVLAGAYSIGNHTKQVNELRALRAVWVGLFSALAGIALVLMVQITLQELLGPDPSPHRLLEFIRRDRSIGAVLWVGASAIVTAPLLEELVYRVVIQGALRSRVGGGPAIGLVALLFCLVHGWPDMLGLFPLAVVLGYVYDRTNSYLAVVTAHAGFNLCMLSLAAVNA